MPTHRRQPDNTQDPVRLRNLLTDADKALRDDPDVAEERRTEVLEQLRQAVAETDLSQSQDGLVIYADAGEHQVWSVARTVPERVVLADTFLTRNLVAAQAAGRPYWVLVVAADRMSLWKGGPGGVAEHTGDGFPLTRSLDDPDAERKERIGDLPSVFRDEATRGFFRRGHEDLRGVLTATPGPLYVIGEAPALSLLEETGPLPQGTPTVTHGGLAHGPAEAVGRAVEPVHQAREEALAVTVVAELDAARGRREFAGGVDETWHAAKDGRIRLLAVEEHYRTVVRDYRDHLEPAEASDPDSREDIVDEIVEQALETGADVRFVHDGTLDGRGRIAAVLRY
ncbi:chemotaxis protein [Streptomyces sp. NPDC051940]|uniref:baeRF3 domain-containing protein n=1 Tax=Streptomyces sp. NPDC051940 TaxID=3155675 RepID=UPI00342945F1